MKVNLICGRLFMQYFTHKCQLKQKKKKKNKKENELSKKYLHNMNTEKVKSDNSKLPITDYKQ